MNDPISLKDDPKAFAKEAGLRYVSDKRRGFGRQKLGKGFIYLDLQGKEITDKETIERIDALAIPPAYVDVWICPHPEGHIQATGIDDRGRKQYRYHSAWNEARQATKYHRMMAFGEALPKIRRQVGADLNLPGVPREKILATLVTLLERTLIRVGNEEYAKENQSYGLTTMKNKHVEVVDNAITFAFKGKSNQFHEITLRDKKLAKIVGKLQDLPGQDLFQYIDEDNNLHEIHSDDVNQYLQDITGQEFTAKDFRTWRGTVLAAVALGKCEKCRTKTEVKRNLSKVIKEVAAELGNTPAVCRKAYIHPSLISTYTEAMSLDAISGYSAEQLEKFKQLRREEAEVMTFLETCG